eukprot:TRINITY_DN3095_c3_g1_i2.p1 TRINITY_DN3095_c3_g1~~TRINITY_DN3095_c3_g1_i2.p1  ORF type:complete len:787 (+),score=236.86 TRINITY_DN3095_c3_g1_i2:63-2363(+)
MGARSGSPGPARLSGCTWLGCYVSATAAARPLQRELARKLPYPITFAAAAAALAAAAGAAGLGGAAASETSSGGAGRRPAVAAAALAAALALSFAAPSLLAPGSERMLSALAPAAVVGLQPALPLGGPGPVRGPAAAAVAAALASALACSGAPAASAAGVCAAGGALLAGALVWLLMQQLARKLPGASAVVAAVAQPAAGALALAAVAAEGPRLLRRGDWATPVADPPAGGAAVAAALLAGAAVFSAAGVLCGGGSAMDLAVAAAARDLGLALLGAGGVPFAEHHPTREWLGLCAAAVSCCAYFALRPADPELLRQPSEAELPQRRACGCLQPRRRCGVACGAAAVTVAVVAVNAGRLLAWGEARTLGSAAPPLLGDPDPLQCAERRQGYRLVDAAPVHRLCRSLPPGEVVRIAFKPPPVTAVPVVGAWAWRWGALIGGGEDMPMGEARGVVRLDCVEFVLNQSARAGDGFRGVVVDGPYGDPDCRPDSAARAVCVAMGAIASFFCHRMVDDNPAGRYDYSFYMRQNCAVIDDRTVFQSPIGSKPGFPPIPSGSALPPASRPVDVNFLGAVTHDRFARVEMQRVARSCCSTLGLRCVYGYQSPFVLSELTAAVEGRAGPVTSRLRDLAAVGYLDVLRASKITLCPAGHNVESFRIWESLAVGSVPIIHDTPYARRKLPNGTTVFQSSCRGQYDFLRRLGAPLTFVRDWGELPGLLRRFTRRPGELRALQERQLDWWRRFRQHYRNLIALMVLTGGNATALHAAIAA